MKASELVQLIQSAIKEHGDLDILLNDYTLGAGDPDGVELEHLSYDPPEKNYLLVY